MVHRPRWLSLASVAMVAMLVLAACGTGSPTTAPSGQPSTAPSQPSQPSSQPSSAPSQEPSTAPSGEPSTAPSSEPSGEPAGTPYPDMAEQPSDPSTISDAYPNYGEVDCEAKTFNGLPYTGNVKTITAPDDHTVVFTLCAPDVAFLSKVAFSVFSINDSDFLIAHTAAGDIQNLLNGTGPFKLNEWRRGDSILYDRFDGYWGDPAATATGVLRWQAEPAARLQELQAGTVAGITLVGPGDFASVEADPNLQLKPAAGLNTLYVGFNHDYAPWDDPEVRRALAIGIDRQRIVDNYMPPGSEVATHFTPCDIPFACTGDAWPDYDPDAARQIITDKFGEAGLTTTIAYRPIARGYIPLPVDTATDLQSQLEQINIHATLDEQESTTFIDNANAGALQGLFLLGWGADYPDVTNFLDYHFGQSCTSAFGQCYPEIYQHLVDGGTTADEAAREAAYTEANNAIRDVVPMVPISHAGFANAYLAGVDHAQVSPLSNELLFRMVPADGGDQIVFMQNGEPGGLYCADETDGESLRACEQAMEGLYGFEEDGTTPIPALAEGCTANEDLTEWTCNLRQGVTYHDGSTFEAKDVIVSFAAQWDAASALHVGRTSDFEYWGTLWGGFLNPPAPCGIEGQPACGE